MLTIAGIALAWVQLDGTLEALWETAYGQRLLLKLALVAGLLVLAVLNRFVLTPRMARGDVGSARALRVSLGADIALALAVLAVTATFPFSPPPAGACRRSCRDHRRGVRPLRPGDPHL